MPWLLARIDSLIKRAAGERELRRLRSLLEKMSSGHVELVQPLDSSDDRAMAAYLVRASQVAEAVLGLGPHSNQLVATAGLVRGFSIELDTGEGKTLVGALAAAAFALAGRGVHILTANDYLAQRDAEWMNDFYAQLGLTCGAVLSTSSLAEKQLGYSFDVTYASAREAGFDLLRDRLATEIDTRTGARYDVVILDEADSILLDEARTPLVLAGEGPHITSSLARPAASVLEALSPGEHYVMAADQLTAYFTDTGIEAIERLWPEIELFGADSEPLTAMNLALHAQALMRRDVDYVVEDGRVWLVSGDTGRVEPLRRWPDGLQQAVEAKEGIPSHGGMVILDQIVVAELVDRYAHVAGMSATLQENADEIERVHGIRTLSVAPNRGRNRVDHAAKLFETARQADEALVRLIQALNTTGRPVLVACQSVADSDRCSSLLSGQGVEHVLLNAKNDREEAEIIKQAGQLAQVTVSTQMAGRGTDIRLSAEARSAGGLFVIGRGNFPNRRLDAQLRGRAGRQGDPGDSVFISSLEDDLVAHVGLSGQVPRRVYSDGRVKDPRLQRVVSHAQRVSEGEQEGLRSLSWRYGRLLRLQRQEVLCVREKCMGPGWALDRLRTHSLKSITRIVDSAGADAAEEGARLAMLGGLDEAWSGHLAFAAEVREGIHLRVLAKEDPLTEFERVVADAFSEFRLQALDRSLEMLQGAVRQDGTLDIPMIRSVMPTASWTYTVTDNSLGSELERMGRGLLGGVRGLLQRT